MNDAVEDIPAPERRGSRAWLPHAKWPCHRSPYHWLTSAVILLFLVWFNEPIERFFALDDAKNRLFQTMVCSAVSRCDWGQVRVVEIEDDLFWSDQLHHRTPLDRAFLARLIRAADAAGAQAIALDFDFRLPRYAESSSVKPGAFAKGDQEYRAETEDLVRAIGEAVAHNKRIVLPKSIAGYSTERSRDGRPVYDLAADGLQPYGICSAMRGTGDWDSPGAAGFPISVGAARLIKCGYLSLMPEPRDIPPPVHVAKIAHHLQLDSFSVAIARSIAPTRIPDFEEWEDWIAPYISRDVSNEAIIDASSVIQSPRFAIESLGGKIVIIGVGYHLLGDGQGYVVDTHPSPIGLIPGALLHANLAQAMIEGKAHFSFPARWLVIIDVAMGMIAVAVLACARTSRSALGRLVALMIVGLGLQWLSLHLIGAFIDMFVPIFGIGLHAIVDRLREGGEAEHAAD